MSDWLTPLENAVFEVTFDPWISERSTAAWRETNRIWKAIMLSPTVEICDALLRGQHVPAEKLNQEWLQRFGMRQ